MLIVRPCSAERTDPYLLSQNYKNHRVHNVLTCCMKDCEVRFAIKVVSDGVWDVGTFAGSFVRWGRSASVGRGLNDPRRTNDPIERTKE